MLTQFELVIIDGIHHIEYKKQANGVWVELVKKKFGHKWSTVKRLPSIHTVKFGLEQHLQNTLPRNRKHEIVKRVEALLG